MVDAYTVPPMPMPPVTINAPVTVDDDCVLVVKNSCPSTVAFPYMRVPPSNCAI